MFQMSLNDVKYLVRQNGEKIDSIDERMKKLERSLLPNGEGTKWQLPSKGSCGSICSYDSFVGSTADEGFTGRCSPGQTNQDGPSSAEGAELRVRQALEDTRMLERLDALCSEVGRLLEQTIRDRLTWYHDSVRDAVSHAVKSKPTSSDLKAPAASTSAAKDAPSGCPAQQHQQEPVATDAPLGNGMSKSPEAGDAGLDSQALDGLLAEVSQTQRRESEGSGGYGELVREIMAGESSSPGPGPSYEEIVKDVLNNDS
eukprot:gnl/TRDRNA2_/TRDRNA2_75778_c0_seq1.p1 gnl/TRDRNA2_/TRDRNA2_75778_c0~~gnl/TRDRNA2_/TRDRNA2_75778_c0_seq1.p1  ORF type:complete len:257 (+),score=46.22 gnl/TRDRNA2_/TRDRNA2_75778_c0_seq1:1-771(+)